MEFLIIGAGVILAIIIYGFIMRKKVYRDVDKMDAWKMDMMNRPVTEEIAEVKKLKMTGQTEEKFERWRNTWDEIVTVGIPQIEEKLFDAEEAADRYKFKKAKSIVEEMQHQLQKMEDDIEGILSQLRELVGSEEKNRIEMEEHKQTMKRMRKILLAERHEFGNSAVILEKAIEEVEVKITLFEEATEAGNYLEAREIILLMTEEINDLAQRVDEIPYLLQQCRVEIPSQLKELINGCSEMVEDGYVLDDEKVKEEIEKIQKEVERYVVTLELGNITDVVSGIEDIKERVDYIYDILEHEVKAKHQITKESPKVKPELNQLKKDFIRTKEETDYVQLSYELKDEDIENIRAIEKAINIAIKKADELNEKIIQNKVPSSTLQKELDKIKDQIVDVKEAHEQFHIMLKTLRKDETNAKEKIVEMKRMLMEAKRRVQKSNLPGLPEFYFIEYNSAEQSIITVLNKMTEKPLNMISVKHLLDEAEEAVALLLEKTTEMIEKAELTEKVIQYGNRYRSNYPIIAAKLDEAEHSFRLFDYDAALEQAAIAIEEIEPGAMKKLEKLLELSEV